MTHLEFVSSKIFKDVVSFEALLYSWKLKGEKIVFTNGCFDLLHYGHLHYLCEARDLGQRLVIGINSTESIKGLKGPNRPIQDEKSRYHLLAALSCVDAVIPFSDPTPIELIKNILPDFLVKGGDYQPENIVGYTEVIQNGGQVLSLPFVNGFSTTEIEKRIKG
jgi:D-glycero-beta-D-manno-heptose 1-phosphate adenylyltransferase